MDKKIVVLGNGYLGSAFSKKGYTIFSKEEFSLVKESQYDYLTDKLGRFDVIINCLAKSNTRFCENNFNDALFSNAIIAGMLQTWCSAYNKKYVHISTGCLYDRNDIPQKETDFLSAHCNYTLTKWYGEKMCDFETALIIRPRLFFDGSDRSANLLNKIKKFDRLCCEFDSISSIDVVVNAVDILLQNNCIGVFNVACDGYLSVFEIGKMLGLDKDTITIDEIRKQQGLYLVNNIMDLSKLKKYYEPPHIIKEIRRVMSL